MSKDLVSTGAIKLEDQCEVMTVANYGATAIPDGSALVVDDTNLDTTQALLAVKTIASANNIGRVGIAKGAIPAATTLAGVTIPGQGQMATGGIVRGLSANTAFTVGQQVATSATAGLVAVSTTVGSILGSIIHAETTTTPLILMTLN